MKQGLVRLLYNFGKRFMGWTLHMIMCVLLCYPVSIRIYYQQGVLFLVYLITCKKCNKYYVGETSRPFRNRMYEHRHSVSQPRENKITPVSRHFTEKGHSVKDMKFSVLEWCSLKYHRPDSKHRKLREKWWMWNIGAIHPIGINQFS